MIRKPVKEKTLILKNTIVTVLVSVFFMGIIFTFYTMVYDKERENIIKDGRMAAMESADMFGEYMLINRDTVQLTAYTLDEMLTKGTSDDAIQEYLIWQSVAVRDAIDANTTGLYGYINGRFFSGVGWTPPEGYDAKERPWYAKPFTAPGEITVLDPYHDVQSGNYMLALGKVLCDGESVVSLDFSLARVQAITEKAAAPDKADVQMILNEEGRVIAHSDKGEINKNYGGESGTLGAAIFEALRGGYEECTEITFAGSRYIVCDVDVQSGWHCISVMDATKAYGSMTVVLILTAAAAVAVIVIVSMIMFTSNKRQLDAEQLNAQLSATADIYISLHEIDFVNDTFKTIRSADNISAIVGKNRSHTQELINKVMESRSDPSTRDTILDFVNFTKVNHRLRDSNTVTCEFLSVDGKWRRARLIVSERLPNGRVAKAMYLVEDIDREKRERDITLEAVKQMNEQISSVANIYFTMQEIDLRTDTLNEIKTKVRRVTELIGGKKDGAQAIMYAVMDQMSDESTRASIHEFIDLSTLGERLKGTNTVTEEFLSTKGIWSRARFIVSKRANDGTIERVLWLVEGIEAEKRKRDMLAKKAETLYMRLSSITNIYKTAYEFDLETDTFTQIRTMNRTVKDIIGESTEKTQETIFKVMKNIVDSRYVDDVLRFVDLSTLQERIGDADTISIEYMDSEKQWRRGRFVVSERGANRRLLRVLWLVEDIDHEKRERDKLIDISERAVAANEAKTKFLSNMSHNIRTPIHAMLGMNELILRESTDSNVLDYAENVRLSGATLLGIVNDIIDISSIEAGRTNITVSEYDISRPISDLVNMVQQEAEMKGLTLTLDIDRNLPRILRGDEMHIEQVVMNLLINAVRYTKKGGITFTVGYEQAAGEPDCILIHVAVKDTGIGMSKEEVSRLLSAVDTDNDGGTIGIRIAESLLRLMGSSLRIESVPGLGSIFSFVLKQEVVNAEPLGDYEKTYRETLEKSRAYREKFTVRDTRVLIADDVPVNLMLLSRLLGNMGMQTDTAMSGTEAVSLARSHRYDIIILDQKMPEKTGVETLREIRADKGGANASVPAICLTANAVSGAREEYIRQGFDDYLTKPLDPEKLEKMLIKYLPEEKITVNDNGEE